MKKKHLLTLLSLLLFAAPSLRAQGNIGAGAMLGSSFYLGDLNPSLPFYKPGVYIGGLINYTFNDYYCLRVNMGGGNFRGVAPSDPNSFLDDFLLVSNNPNAKPTSFNQSYFHLDTRLEVGFMPYDPGDLKGERNNFSPYYAIGIGLAFATGNPFLQLPVAIGVKYRFAYRFTLGAEWTFCKTFSDNLDGWENIHPELILQLNNYDWISYFGIYFTFQLTTRDLCPAYM